ncbi:MAG: flagellar hook-basal body complex protein FliE [Ruminococcaceae bacterium]|jgi:flagellar hook-basal body complex protein FliE|nr:flagellar hook-basal body complex protein FliE [Oscillospiraceae bacterium]
MNTIQPLWTELPLSSAAKTEAPRVTDTKGNPFSDIFQSAIDAVKTTDAEKTQMEYLMATGQLDNPSLLTIASTKAQLSVDLMVQLRNKSMEAYNELMRINL